MVTPAPWLLVAIGGSLGATARYFVGSFVARHTQLASLPWGTLAVNSLGSFLLGMLMASTIGGRFVGDPEVRLLLGVGFLGSFTTFSTLSYETLEAFRTGSLLLATWHLSASLILGLGACWFGLFLGSR